ncbi:MAG: DsbA family protein [Rickettsiales bacterium]|nr:DsbA family protein [Rickettsiales bacterium]
MSGDKAIAAWTDKNAETILNSVNKFVMQQQEKMQKQQQGQAGENIKKLGVELSDIKTAGVLNPKGKIELVEFFDYNCHYCQMSAKNVEELLKTRSDVRVILRAIPILGEPSNYATQVGTAVLMMEPAKYPVFYKEIMSGSARTKDSVAKAVEASGLKMSKVEKFMEKNQEQIKNIISSNVDLAKQIGINGTPAFIVNGELIPGAVDAATLSSKLVK